MLVAIVQRPLVWALSGFYFSCDDVGLEDTGHFFLEFAEKLQGTKHLLKMQSQPCGHTLFQDVQKPSLDEGRKTR